MTKLSFSKWGSEYVDRKLEEYQNNPLKPTKQILENIFRCIDLTSLSSDDTEQSIKELAQKAEFKLDDEHDSIKVAGVCVYPRFVKCLYDMPFGLMPDWRIVSVAGGFPHAQTPTEVKVMEVKMAAEAGADEIDVVINAGDIKSGNLFAAYDDLKAMRNACPGRGLKVILETGIYDTDEQIYDAAVTAMYAGANFIKTSTGKYSPAATPRSALIMALAINDFKEANSIVVGLKVAGGIRTTAEALQYAKIAKEMLQVPIDEMYDDPGYDRHGYGGEVADYFGYEPDHLRDFFRIGATSLAQNIIEDIKKMQ